MDKSWTLAYGLDIGYKMIDDRTKTNTGALFSISMKGKQLCVVELPEVCIQQFFQVECLFPCNRIEDQIHGTLPYPTKFYSPRHRLAGHFHLKHSSISLSRKP